MLHLQVGISAAKDEVEQFLQHMEVVHPATTGTRVQFRGKYLKLPEDLKADLTAQFGKLNIRVAEMKYLNWGMDPVNLMLFQNKDSGEVVTYLWDIWFSDAPFSFGSVMGSHIKFAPNSKSAFHAICRLIAFSMDGSVSQLVDEKDASRATINDRHKRPWRIISYSGGALIFMKPQEFSAQDGDGQVPAVPEPE